MNIKGESITVKGTNEDGVVMGKDKGLYVVYLKDTEGNVGEIKKLSKEEIEVKSMGSYGH